MKILATFVIVCHISVLCAAGTIKKSLDNSVTENSTEISEAEEQLIELFALAKEDLRKQSNTNVADIIRNLIDLNATGVLQNSPESCPPYANAHGIYKVKLGNLQPFDVFCDTQMAGPGWTVIQRRIDGNLNFYRNWTQYKNGFGNISEEFFIGLDKLHAITSEKPHELYIQLEDFNGEKRYARYEEFRISDEANYYLLEKLGSYSGNAGDALDYHRNMKFTTYDADHGPSNQYCAEVEMGAWWYKDCAHSSLNGLYLNPNLSSRMQEKGIYWHHWKGTQYSYKSVQMMVRPRCPCSY